ncbi:MAG TPA: double-cubane-cluster-containing anaerobic reductase [Syntrophorhabdaceae bacterium]|nr:double-cubane-cluster-containing anaerobic reductase [Syntrophorhabdaceae bacterium]
MNETPAPLIQDEFTGEPPTKRVLAHLQAKREEGKKIAGIYCGYAPTELIRAMGIVPASLCAFSNATIEAAEAVLPVNLCPLIKSSFGFVITDTCPFYGISDAVIGETTCDGKKKMFELIGERKPTHIMDLPQLPDEEEALNNWTIMIRKLQKFLERTFNAYATDDEIEAAIKDTNHKNAMMRTVIDYAALNPPVVGWRDLYDLCFLSHGVTGKEMEPVLIEAKRKLEERKAAGYTYGPSGAPRILVTGCPVGGDAQKVFNIIEEGGGTIVALDSCSGFKPFATDIEEKTGDPMRAIAARSLKIPCSCMTPNMRRLTEITRIIERFKPDAVVDVVLQACHSYNIESYKVGEHVQKNHGLPFLKIVTDFSQSDVGQIRTRVEALLESC